MQTKHLWLVSTILLLFSVSFFGCNQDKVDTARKTETNSSQSVDSKKEFKLGVSLYVGWMPWYLANDDSTLADAAKEKGISIDVVTGDSVETFTQYAGGNLDAVVMTNIDAISFLINSNVESDVVLIGSFSNGNDAILLRPDQESVENTTLGLVEYSVSHYLLDRYLELNSIDKSKVKVLNIADSEIAGAFAASGDDIQGVVTWNPIVMQIEDKLKGKRLFDSSEIEEEIADLLVVRRTVAESNPEFVQTLLETWFEVTGRLDGDKRAVTVEALGKLCGTDGDGYERQLKTTDLINTTDRALEELRDERMKKTMVEVREFAEANKLVKKAPANEWVTYPGQQKGIIHFNDKFVDAYAKELVGN